MLLSEIFAMTAKKLGQASRITAKYKVNFDHRSSDICSSHKLTNIHYSFECRIKKVAWYVFLQRKLNYPLWVMDIP